MRSRGRLKARRIALVPDEPLLGGRRYDYADAFEIELDPADPRTAEQFARCALEESGRAIRTLVSVAHRHVLRLRLAPPSSPDHVLGWHIATSEPDVLQLEATSPLLGHGVIVGRRVDRNRSVIETFVFYTRSRTSRVIWAVVSPVHRRIAPYLLERAAAAGVVPETTDHGIH